MFDAEDLPSESVPARQALARALAAHSRAHPNAALSTHEQGVLAALRTHAPALLSGVLKAATVALQAPGTPARLVRAGCAGCQRRRRPQSRTGRSRTVLTRLGPVTLHRLWYHCRRCRIGWSPPDQTLGLARRQRTSPGLQQWEALLGARLPFAESQRVLAELTGVALGTETLRTHTEQVGASVVAVEPTAIAHVLATRDPRPDRYAPVPDDQRLVIETDGVMVRYRGTGWHEVKVAEAVGRVLGNGRPRDDPAYRPPRLVRPSSTAAREPTNAFDARRLALAAERGALDIIGYQQPPGTDPRLAFWGEHTACLRPVVILADGAPWLWARAARCFGADRIEIVDAWHAVQHRWTVAKALFGEATAATTAWVEAAKTDLWTVGPLPVLQRLKAAVPPTPEAAEVLRVERASFTTNAPRMRYPQLRAQGLPVGSGAIESAARHLVQQRLKGAGMRWSIDGAAAILALRSLLASSPPPATRVG